MNKPRLDEIDFENYFEVKEIVKRIGTVEGRRYSNAENIGKSHEPKIKQAEIADALGVTVKTWQNWKADKRDMSSDTINKLCDLLECSRADLEAVPEEYRAESDAIQAHFNNSESQRKFHEVMLMHSYWMLNQEERDYVADIIFKLAELHRLYPEK